LRLARKYIQLTSVARISHRAGGKSKLRAAVENF
jgi:hypothetical protein